MWKEVEMCGDRWMMVNGVLFFIYTPVSTIHLAGKPRTANIPLVARYLYHLFHFCSFGAVFTFISFKAIRHDLSYHSRGHYSARQSPW